MIVSLKSTLGVSGGVLLLLVPACTVQTLDEEPAWRPQPDTEAPYQAEVEEGIGAAVVFVVDTSGSMEEPAEGSSEPKHLVARRALERAVAATTEFTTKRPDFPIKVALFGFASTPIEVLPIGLFDAARFSAGLAQLPGPGGGTAIGEAMLATRPSLYQAGVFRKYMIVVTDGDNTTGRFPEPVSRHIHEKSEGVVQIYFVAFDTSPAKFGFLKDIGGDVIGAESAEQLEAALKEIYAGRILAEVDYGETLQPVSDRSNP